MLEYDFTDLVTSRSVPNDDGWYWDVEFDPLTLPDWLNIIHRRYQTCFNINYPDQLIAICCDGRAFMRCTSGWPIMETEGEYYYSTCIGAVNSIFVLPSERNQGLQTKILKDLKSDACGAKEPVLLCAQPFEMIKDPGDNIFRALEIYAEGEKWIRYVDDQEEIERQRKRFIAAGYINSPFDMAGEHDELSDFMIVPGNLDDKNTLKILELKNIIKTV